VYRALLLVFLLFLAGEVLAPVQSALRWLVIVSVDGHGRDHVMRATLSGTDMTHLHGSEYLEALERVRGFISYSGTPGGGAAGIVTVTREYITGLAFAVVLAWFQPLIALLALSVSMFIRLQWRAATIGAVNAWTDGLPAFDEARYFVELGLGRPAAHEVRLFGLREWLGQRVRAAGIRGWTPSWNQRTHNMAPKVVLHLVLSGAAAVTCLVWAARSAASGELSVADLVVFVPTLLGVLSLGRVFNDDVTVEYGASMLPAMDALDGLADRAVARESGRTAVSPHRPPSIEFNSVTFRYPGTEVDVLTDVDLSIAAGSSVALVGLNGAGKTTLVRLLCGLYRPQRGAVIVDGTNLEEVDLEAWHRLIAPMFQEFLRLQVTVADNVAVGAVERADDRAGILEAMSEAGVREFAERLPDGIDTLLSVGQAEGNDLSGGQWQRVGIARALFGLRAGARTVILDEPTSNLDTASEERLVRRLIDENRRRATTLLITHRLALARRADRIYILERGRVVEEGTHSDLVRLGGRYASAFSMQASLYPLEEGDGGG
jgi:ATP-binding cassette subfamily B protein